MTLESFLPDSGARLRRLFARLDPDFASVWETHVSRLLDRDHLDDRTRFLVMTAQYTVRERHGPLRETMGAALGAGVEPKDLLEVILQLYVYTGPWVVAGAAEQFESVLAERGEVLAEMPQRPDRDLDAERQTWTVADRNDDRIDAFLERYGWHAIANGLRLRPGHHINMLDTLDTLDPHFLQTWLDAVYEGMYGRGRLDDRTRLLCVVGATLALGETHQSRRHMRAAMRAGATPRELLEVVFHTTAFFGHPYVMPAAFDDLVRIAHDEGKVTDLIPADKVDDTLHIINARVARRHDIVDGIG
jgi:alkylhydroperoxidase/carboxymuconolactone decarboxylase family protein YurZ